MKVVNSTECLPQVNFGSLFFRFIVHVTLINKRHFREHFNFSLGPEKKSPSKPMESEIPECGNFVALLDEYGSSNENGLVSSNRLSLDLKAGNEKINDVSE